MFFSIRVWLETSWKTPRISASYGVWWILFGHPDRLSWHSTVRGFLGTMAALASSDSPVDPHHTLEINPRCNKPKKSSNDALQQFVSKVTL